MHVRLALGMEREYWLPVAVVYQPPARVRVCVSVSVCVSESE